MTGRGLSLGPCMCPAPAIFCTGASRRLRPRRRLGRPVEPSRGGRGRGRARACQRVPGIIYDVRPMSLSAACLGLAASSSWTDRRASHLALSPFAPRFIGS